MERTTEPQILLGASEFIHGPLLKHHRPDNSFKQLTNNIKEVDSEDSMDNFNEDTNLSHNLGDCHVILITGVLAMEYVLVVMKIQGMGLPIRQDDMPFDLESSTVAVDVLEVLGKELMVGPWLDVFGSGVGHRVYIQNLATTSSHMAIVGFFAVKCGAVLNSHFSKLLDSSKVISMVHTKSAEEQEAEVKAHATDQCKHANRSAETQPQQLQAEWKAHNDSALPRAACTDLDNATGDTILPIMVTGGVLNLVSINITHSPAHLDMVNWLMSKHGWHIVLVQETGLLCDAEVGMEDHIHCQLTNNIHFNSPSTPTLHAKQTAVQLSKLDHQLHEGHISQAQFDSKKMAINSS
ncbi:uncharacterized protein ACA1_121490 [Acanthamoeba castellanii str. Neff]|uniref:Uncharacterized protein n=1 Tax=Acanthamoeba castellanii (strain ATCC 30010 / Neff) TaxID=1257118 RepID=L8GGW5_ACACF|nr:uncharacterized protein ACA1_121490 [Acanthamoeba castellanii str. Neff]ELR11441.1 hypothetical protein ACA1_121490 [Acanthamoeba castellanii str. Neff]